MASYMNQILRQRCEVYSRVNGYLRPVSQWNDAKQSEHKQRKFFKTDKRNV